jgi:hypothetical protein
MLNSNRPISAKKEPEQPDPNDEGFPYEPENEEEPEELYPGDGIFPNNELEGAQRPRIRGLAVLAVGLLFGLAGCDGSSAATTPEGIDGGIVRTDSGARPTTNDAKPLPDVGYSVLEDLGYNYCVRATVTSGWDPSISPGNAVAPAVVIVSSVCYPPTEASGRGGVCGAVPACGTYAAGTILVWSEDDPRFIYQGNALQTDSAHPNGGGYLCLPNNVPYVVPCS